MNQEVLAAPRASEYFLRLGVAAAASAGGPPMAELPAGTLTFLLNLSSTSGQAESGSIA